MGLPNRRTILEMAGTQLAHYRRYGGAFTILMVDVDNFKMFNDRYGHLEGDRVLRLVHRRCAARYVSRIK